MKLRKTILLFALVLAPQLVRAELVVIAHPKSGIDKLSREEVTNIYLGRYRRLSSGLTAEPLDLQGEVESKVRFYRSLVGKSLAEINAYWARLVFSGKTRPPQVVATVEEALQYVASHPGAMAYVERSKADKRVSIVFEMGD
jgi:hypothetical protein